MKKYIIALRAPFLLSSVVPVLISASWAVYQNCFFWKYFFVVLIGVASLHLGANLINDYFDATGSDPINLKVTPFSGGSRVIQEMGVSRGMVLAMSITAFLLAGLCCAWLIANQRAWSILLGLIGLFLGWAYSSPPFSLMSRGFGELAIFLAFGPVLTLASFYAISGQMDSVSFFLGIPQGCFITNVIWINQFPDVEADRGANKLNLVVRLGPNFSRFLYGLLALTGILFPFLLVGMWHVPQMVLISLISVPLCAKAFWILFKNYKDHEKVIPGQALTIKFLAAHGLLLSLGILLGKVL
jgi:1,4-dihydroxy-2-naphthoate octaprenyltransferase